MLPDLGEGLTEGEIVRWLVAAGDVVAVDTPVAEVETAKSVVELPSPYAGVVAELHGEVGTVVPVGQPLITIAGESAGETYREEERAGSGNVLVGYGTADGGAGRRRRPQVRGGESAREQVVRSAEPVQSARVEGGVVRVVSPLVRRMAKDGGVDLRQINGSGPGGLIVRRDVEGVLAAPKVVERTGLPELRRERMSGFRKVVAATLSRSRSEIPEATTWVDVDATALIELRKATKDGPGLLAYMARFVVAGLAKYPELNGFVDGDELVQYDGVNLGLAAQTDRGLVVPAIANAHRLTARELDGAIRTLTESARLGKLTPEELNRGTFTLNNYGSFGVDGSAAIINHPQVAILGVGRIIDRPWVVDGELAVRKLTQLSLVFDHRVCDGGTAAGFLRFVADAFENPGSVLADL
nr:dihydrolipoamide acetyltransferase family protein [Kribbella sandramycini]